MKPFLYCDNGLWICHERFGAHGEIGIAFCPFVAYMRWMEKSIKAGEQ